MEETTLFIPIILVVMMAVAGGIIWLYKPPSSPCQHFKTITEIQTIPLANFWGKKIVYIVHYDNGGLYETDFGDLYRVGNKTCSDD